MSKKPRLSHPKPRPLDDQTPRDRAIIAWCSDLAEWAVVEYSPTDNNWRETTNYGAVTPTHWLPIELPGPLLETPQ